MRLNLLYILAGSLLLAFTACDSMIYDSYTQPETPQEAPEVYLSVTRAQAADTETINEDETDFEDRVHDLAMLVFDSSTGDRICSFLDENIPLSKKEKTFTVKLTTGVRDFYFVANMPMSDLEGITDRDQMVDYMTAFYELDADLYLNASEDKGFPMSRVYLNQSITQGGNIYSPKPFKPDGEERVRLIRTVAKLEVKIEGDIASSGVKNIYYKNASRSFSPVSRVNPIPMTYHTDQPLKKVGDSYFYYMPGSIMDAPPSWTAAPDHKPVNYFRIETLKGTFYDIPIITDTRVITDTDYLSFATGREPGATPDYNIYRNRHYYYLIKNLQTIQIIYSIDPWTVRNSATYMGYGYNVTVDEDERVNISNTIEVCDPHKVTLKAINGCSFTDDQLTKTFEELDPTDSQDYILKNIPVLGDYLEVWYNDVRVKTFAK